MKIKTFFENPGFLASLNNSLESRSGELYLVCAEYRRPGYNNDERTVFDGLDVAWALDSDEYPIILCSFMPDTYFAGNNEFSTKFHALLARKRVGFMRLPFTADELFAKYEELLNCEREEDLLAVELEKNLSFRLQMGIIEHSIGHILNRGPDQISYDTSRIAEAITEARKIGVTGTDEEVLKQIKDFKREPKKRVFAGKFFPGIFCDVQGTLIINNKINQGMLQTLHNLSSKKPITLWTGGNLEEIRRALSINGIFWKLVSKDDLAGAIVEIAYDDEDYSVFWDKYQIEVGEYIRV